MYSGRKKLWVILVIGWLLTLSSASAQIPTNNPLDQIVETFRNNTSQWDAALRAASSNLFWTLATISFVVQAVPLALRGSQIYEGIEYIVAKALSIGFFYALFVNSANWAEAIIDMFREFGNVATSASGGVSGYSPANIFDSGLQLASRLSQDISFWNGIDSVGVVLAALIVIVVFAFIAAEMFVALVKMYFVINAGVVLAAFGGAHWTQKFALNFLVVAFAIGLELFFLQLIVGLGAGIITGWAESLQQQNTQVLAMVGVVIVFFEVAKQVPKLASSLVTGGINTGGYRLGLGSMHSVSSAASAIASPARSALGATSLAKAAASVGGVAGMDAYKSTRSSGAGRTRAAAGGIASFTRAVVPRLASAGLDEFRTGGNYKRKSALDRMSANMTGKNTSPKYNPQSANKITKKAD